MDYRRASVILENDMMNEKTRKLRAKSVLITDKELKEKQDLNINKSKDKMNSYEWYIKTQETKFKQQPSKLKSRNSSGNVSTHVVLLNNRRTSIYE